VIGRLARATMVAVAAATFSASASADPSLERVTQAKVLRIGVAINIPWVVRTAGGQLTGYDVELARALAADLGVAPQFVEMPFGDLVARLARGDVDMVASGLAITPARARAVMFSNTTGSAAIRVVASRAALGTDPAKALSAPGFTIGALADSTDADAARQAFSNAKVVTFPSAADALAALLNGTTQAMVATAPVPRLTATLYDAKFQLLRRPLTHTPEAFALRADDTRLLGYVNNWISAKAPDGTIENANDYWFGRMMWLRSLETDIKSTQASASPTK